MKEFITNLISSSTLASSKRFVLIMCAIVLCTICLKAAWEGEYVLPVTTLAGLVITLAEMNRRENKLKIETKNDQSSETPNG